MKNSVILKSFSNGISVILDSVIPFEELLNDIAVKFRDADGFFKDASVAISLEGRALTEVQERQILDQKIERYVRTGVDVAKLVLPIVFYGIWLKKGFKFEETGVYSSTTFKNLFNHFKPTQKS